MSEAWWKADDCITCRTCSGRAHDAVRVKKRRTLLVCCYCGVGEWTYFAPAPPPTTGEGFCFPEGRHEGKTIREVDAEPGGRQYLEWMANNEPKYREVVSQYLAAAPQA